MNYNKTTWQTDDVITAEKLNKLENGIVNNGALIVNCTEQQDESLILDKTWQEIWDAYYSGRNVIIYDEDGLGLYNLIYIHASQDDYSLYITGSYGLGLIEFQTSTANGYPSCSSSVD